jgi:hypothetical protein
MAPSTSPPTSRKSPDADTIRKTRFFHAIDHRPEHVFIKDVCKQEDVHFDRGKYWLRQRRHFGDVACRRRSRSDRSRKVSSDLMNQMLDPIRNPMRDQSWSAQIEHFYLDIASCTLPAAFNQRKPRASRFKEARVRMLSNKNKQLRVQYAEKHKSHTIEDFWQRVHFTDEAHFDPDQMYEERVLREEGTRYEPENLQTMPEMKEVKLHVTASISWHHKGALQFYNDEHDMPDIQITKPRKPRRQKHDTDDEHC